MPLLTNINAEAALHRCFYEKMFLKMQQIYRRTPMPKCNFNKVAKQQIEIPLPHGCFPVNLLHIFRIPFFKNISGGLPLLVQKCKTV